MVVNKVDHREHIEEKIIKSILEKNQSRLMCIGLCAKGYC